jgi:hypothetical protein
VLQVVQESGITARETDDGTHWNRASAGRYQDGEGIGRVKRLKKVAVVFGSVGGAFFCFFSHSVDPFRQTY